MITHIAISDLHAGAPTSLIMPFDQHAAETPQLVTTAFATALGAFLTAADAKPQLIMLGDLLDMQFSNRIVASRNAIGFLRAIKSQAPLADDVLATAGNHDHAIWTDARFGLELSRLTPTPPPFQFDDVTPAFRPSTAQSRNLNAVLQAAGFDNAEVRYPNIGFRNTTRQVVLHHGHFVEEAYRLISVIVDSVSETPRKTLTARQIAQENAGWIDFFWASVGDAGFSHDASDIYQNLLTTTGYRHLSELLAGKLGHALSNMLPMSGNQTLREVIRTASRVGIDLTLGHYRDSERYAEVVAMTPDGMDGLRWYLDGPVIDQIDTEADGPADDVTFAFGHTHKPFADRVVTQAFPHPVKVYNTGGWTLNGPRLDNAEGAAMLVMDADLNVANIRLFGTPQNGESPAARIEMLGSETESAQDFRSTLHRCLEKSSDEWRALAHAAGKAYREKQAYLLDLTAHNEAAE